MNNIVRLTYSPYRCKEENNLIEAPLSKRDLVLEVQTLPRSPIESKLEFFPPIFLATLPDRLPLFAVLYSCTYLFKYKTNKSTRKVIFLMTFCQRLGYVDICKERERVSEKSRQFLLYQYI